MLIGRESERRVIEPLIAGARVGQSGVLVLVGEAGIGKTALLDWTASRGAGMLILRATGVEAEREVPFGGLLQLLRPLLELIDELPGPQADALGAAFALRAAAAGDRFAVGAGTLALVCRAADRQPLALLVDDAHLLDRPSAEALAFAARRLLADPVMLLATVRSGEASVLTEAGLPELRVGALDLPSATALLAVRRQVPLPAGTIDLLHRATGGNPLALLELSTDSERLLRLPPDAPVPVPRAIARAVQRETGRLDPPARTALLIAAASGGDLALVQRSSGMLGIDVAALDRCVAAGLVRIVEGRVLFRHPLVRSSVYAAADSEERRTVHRALAAALPELDLERRPWHLAEASTGPDDAAADLLERVAVRATNRSADAVASTAFERAARLSPDDAAGIGRLLSAGEAAWLAGQGGRAGALLTEALGRATEPRQRVRAQEVLGAIAARTGSLTDARDILSAAAREAAEFDTETAVVLLSDAVNACFYLGDSAWAVTAIDRSAGLLASAVTFRAQILGLMAIGTAELLAGRGGMEPVRRAVELLTASDELRDDPRRMAVLVLAPLFLRESATGRDLINRAVAEGRRRSAIGTLPMLLFHLARDHAATDQWPAATSEYHESIRLAREAGQTTDLGASLAGLGWLEGRMGRRDDCVAHLTEAARLCETHQISLFRAWAFFGLGDLELGQGSIERALTHFDDMAAFLSRARILDVDLSPDPERVDILLRVGRADDARRIARDYADRADAKGQPWAMARARRCLAMTGPDGDADGLFAAALALHANTLDEYERAKTLLAKGSRLRRSRRRADARTPLRDAFEIFDRLGAAPLADAAAIELRATGERPRGRGASVLADLTPQELQIASMLAGGQSTREAASALFLSPKTVEYHLRHVYTKLAVHSREELARLLSR
jgi:DNA-binding CsgD family transcriptional regulator/tetratricopeptide (TPR) repeat protein